MLYINIISFDRFSLLVRYLGPVQKDMIDGDVCKIKNTSFSTTQSSTWILVLPLISHEFFIINLLPLSFSSLSCKWLRTQCHPVKVILWRPNGKCMLSICVECFLYACSASHTINSPLITFYVIIQSLEKF